MIIRLISVAACLTFLFSGVATAQDEPRVGRLPQLTLETLTPAQKAASEEIAKLLRNPIPAGPFSALLHEPGMALGALQLFTASRADRQLDVRLFELMISILARHWNAQFEWYVHAPSAVAAGVSPEAIEAIRTGGVPKFEKSDEQTVYDVITELMNQRRLSQATYDRAIAILGQEQVVELITIAGYYTMIAMTVVAFEVPIPAPNPARPLP